MSAETQITLPAVTTQTALTPMGDINVNVIMDTLYHTMDLSMEASVYVSTLYSSGAFKHTFQNSLPSPGRP